MAAVPSHPGRFRGISRGVFGLSSWDEVRKPGQPAHGMSGMVGRGMPTQNGPTSKIQDVQVGQGERNRTISQPINQVTAPGIWEQSQANSNRYSQERQPTQSNNQTNEAERLPVQRKEQGEPAPAQQSKQTTQETKKAPSGPPEPPVAGTGLAAKYSYKANPSSPLETELSMLQKDCLKFLAVHPDNEHWWLVQKNLSGDKGYVPATYLLVVEVTSLPWGSQNQEEEPQPVKSALPFKYKSSYTHAGIKSDTPNWECNVCDKKLNGPQPYSSHMNSKAHKEEVELARDDKWGYDLPGFQEMLDKCGL